MIFKGTCFESGNFKGRNENGPGLLLNAMPKTKTQGYGNPQNCPLNLILSGALSYPFNICYQTFYMSTLHPAIQGVHKLLIIKISVK